MTMTQRRKRPLRRPRRSPLDNMPYDKSIKEHEEESFFVTNLKVGSTLLCIGALAYGLVQLQSILFPPPEIRDSVSEETWRSYVGVGSSGGDGDGNGGDGEGWIMEFPQFEPPKQVGSDVWGLAELLRTSGSHKDSSLKSFAAESKRVREEFASDYGGENAARELYRRGIHLLSSSSTTNQTASESKKMPMKTTSSIIDSIPTAIRRTANRIKNAKSTNKPLQISFAGTTATTGRGNHFDESFPSILAGILEPPLSHLGISLHVRNAAIEDVSTFPYGWCLDNFLGPYADVISWDSDMSARSDSERGMEAYLRRALVMPHDPMVIVREVTHSESRRELLQSYVDAGVLFDPLIIDVDSALEPFRRLHPEITPDGLKDWGEFGAPDGAPGKVRTNLSRKQHELIGRLLAIYFLGAAELVAWYLAGADPSGSVFQVGRDHQHDNGENEDGSNDYDRYRLPPPLSKGIMNLKKENRLPSFLFGTPSNANTTTSNNNNNTSWILNPIQCHTTFQPTVTKPMQNILISGSSAEELDPLLPRGPVLYNKAWVLDMSRGEKTAKRLVKQYHLGYVDSRMGYYGVPPSGSLRFFLYPHDTVVSSSSASTNISKSQSLFQSIIVCEVSELRGMKQCNLETDVSFVVGGVKSEPRYIDAEGVSFLGKKMCVSLGIPSNATLVTRMEMKKDLDVDLDLDLDLNVGKAEMMMMNGVENEQDDYDNMEEEYMEYEGVGLSLDISVTSKKVFWKDGPCSISHVIWEQIRNSP